MHNRGRSRDMYQRGALRRCAGGRSPRNCRPRLPRRWRPASAGTRSSSTPGWASRSRRGIPIRRSRALGPPGRARTSAPQRAVAQVVPEGRARRRSAGGARLGHGRGGRRQCPARRAHRPRARGPRDGAGRPGCRSQCGRRERPGGRAAGTQCKIDADDIDPAATSPARVGAAGNSRTAAGWRRSRVLGVEQHARLRARQAPRPSRSSPPSTATIPSPKSLFWGNLIRGGVDPRAASGCSTPRTRTIKYNSWFLFDWDVDGSGTVAELFLRRRARPVVRGRASVPPPAGGRAPAPLRSRVGRSRARASTCSICGPAIALFVIERDGDHSRW